MNHSQRRPLSLDGLRAFEAVARRLSFSAAADELHLTQSAISRQIKALETEVGAPLFTRGTRKVELTADGQTLRQALLPALDGIDRAVRQIRVSRGRRSVRLSTFASFASLWLLPRLPGFQQQHPDIDIRITATDALIELDDPDLDLALRYDQPGAVPPTAEPMFGELLTPVVSPWLLQQTFSGQAPPLRRPADLAAHALLEDDYHRPANDMLSWRHWLRAQGLGDLEPRRWVFLNFTHQQIQGALAGQGVALARLALVHDALARGELVEPFGPAGRLGAPSAYWLLPLPGARLTAELRAFLAWVRAEASATRAALGPAEPASAP
ncbi:MAG TPA: LysR substrate-binding domain-containing protein [Aquabacterium sp.]|nr:LysR substrate-binding domain-containing protein [Aquabacterium sp.]HQC99246.1 LysR substrate-binding domain-containing protein [Aquabacterium sp.]